MVADGASYPWSSAAYHLSGKQDKTVMTDHLHDSAFSYREFGFVPNVAQLDGETKKVQFVKVRNSLSRWGDCMV